MADPRIAHLIDRGLQHFAQGDLADAIDCWKQVLAIEPANERAREYLALVARTGLPEARSAAEILAAPSAAPSAADLLPWHDDGPAGAPAHAADRPLDAWFAAPESALPPLGDMGAAWREWQSEVSFAATGELPWLPEDPPPAPPAAAPPPARPEPPADPWSAGESQREAPPPPAWTGWTPGPGSTGWDLASAGAAVQLADDDAGADALGLLDDALPRPVAVPKAVENLATPGPDLRVEADTLMQGARELFDLGDFSGSLELVQKALSLQPRHRDALAYLERNQDTLVQMYESKLGSLETRPRVVLRPDEIVWLNLDHRAGFVLAQIDGTVTVDDLYALSGLSRLDTAKILAELVEQGVIAA